MFDPTSRYYRLETLKHVDRDGREVAYKRRRFLPPGESLPLLAETEVVQSERLDQITARTLGEPTHFWRICDANDAMNPLELTDETGRTLRVPLPQP